MEISAEKTKLMANNIAEGPLTDIFANGQSLGTVNIFEYIGAIVSDEGSIPEVIARIAQATSAIAKLKTIWRDKNIKLYTKVKKFKIRNDQELMQSSPKSRPQNQSGK